MRSAEIAALRYGAAIVVLDYRISAATIYTSYAFHTWFDESRRRRGSHVRVHHRRAKEGQGEGGLQIRIKRGGWQREWW